MITPEFPGSFVSLVTPRGIKGDPNSKPKYQMTVVLPSDNPFWKEAQAMVEQAAMAKWGKVPPKLKTPIKDGDLSDFDNMHDCMTISATNSSKPGIVGPDLQPVLDPDNLYSGAIYRASISTYAWEHQTGKGVSFSLNNVMWVRDGDRLGGGGNAADEFKSFATEVDDILA